MRKDDAERVKRGNVVSCAEVGIFLQHSRISSHLPINEERYAKLLSLGIRNLSLALYSIYCECAFFN